MVGVPLEGEGRCGVAREGLEVADGFPTLGEEGEAAMPEVVEPDAGEAGSHEEGLEVPVDDVLGLDGTASEGGEHEAVVLPRGAGH